MAIGGRGVVSVASNEAPAEMAQIVELCEKGDFAGRAQAASLAAAADPGQLRRSPIPIPCKAAMAAMGLLEESYRLPLVPAERRRRATR